MPFQTTVNTYPAPACAGDFASDNPRASLVSPEAGFVAGSGGVNAGVFAWVQNDGKTVQNVADGVVLTFGTPAASDGTGYTTASGLATTGGSGSGCTVSITASGGAITAATVTSGGTGYKIGDVLTVVQSGGAAGTLTVATITPTGQMGFVPRRQQGLITTYLAEYGNNVPAGFAVTVMRTGDYWFKANNNAAVRGQKIFANLSDGTTQTAATGATVSGYIETNFFVSQACGSGELGIMSY